MRTVEEMEQAISDSFKEEAERWVMKPIDPVTVAGKIVFWVAILKALGSEQALEYLINVGLNTHAEMDSEPKWKM